jgi:hypothetical protein
MEREQSSIPTGLWGTGQSGIGQKLPDRVPKSSGRSPMAGMFSHHVVPRVRFTRKKLKVEILTSRKGFMFPFENFVLKSALCDVTEVL